MGDAFAWARSHLGRSASVTRCPACTVSKGPPVATAGLAFAACQVRQPACHTTCGVACAARASRPGVLRLPHPSWTRGYVPACAQSAASARRISHGQRGPGPRECRERGPAGLGNLAGRNASSVPRLHSPHGALTWSTRPPRRLRHAPAPRLALARAMRVPKTRPMPRRTCSLAPFLYAGGQKCLTLSKEKEKME